MLLPAIIIAACVLPGTAQTRRRMTPVDTPATQTQSFNETATDTARINAKRRARSTTYVDKRGYTIYVDTLTNEEWMDSTLLDTGSGRKLEYPLLHSLSIGVNLWDPLMRAFGQEHGIADAWVELSMHNRFKPVVEAGLGAARHRGPNDNYTYRSPLSVFFRIGMNYNFLFNSNSDYQFMTGVRYGFAPFSYSIDDVRLDAPYWGESINFNIPAQHATAGWLEFQLGLRVKLWGPISAGWTFKYHTILHESRATYGKPWYIPGYGSRNGAITGAVSIIYTLPLKRVNKIEESGVDIPVSDGSIPDVPQPSESEENTDDSL